MQTRQNPKRGIFATEVQREQECLGLVDRLLSRLPQASQWEAVSYEELEPILSQVLKMARAAWPTVALQNEVFMPYLARRLPAQRKPRLDIALNHLRAGDLYLACACAHGHS